MLDAGPDINNQWADWAAAPRQFDGITFMHGYDDHMGCAPLFAACDPPVPAFATRETLVRLKQFAAAVWPEDDSFNLLLQPLPERGSAEGLGVAIETLPVRHTAAMTDTALLIRHRGLCWLVSTSVRG